MARETKPAAQIATLAGAKRSQIDPFIVMDVISAAARREAQGDDIVHMEVGQPATAAPAAAREALRQHLERDALGYTEALGRPALRRRIAKHYRDFYGLTVDPERVVVTTGSSAGFILAFLSLFDVGERVALGSPGYPCYRQILSVLGLDPMLIQTGEAERWAPTPEQVSHAVTEAGVKGVLVASPANPTGAMLEPGRLKALIDVCVARKAWFISDEIYHGLSYAFPDETALTHSDQVIVINSFSKYFSMTGWRIGWMIVPTELVRVVERVAQNLFISAPTPSQVAALGAFDAIEELEANKSVYERNRDILLDQLTAMGVGPIVPCDGAFYLYADISRHASDSVAFAGQMLDEIGVAVTPGVDFDAQHGRRFLRFSYAGATAQMIEGMRRLKAWKRLA